MTTMCRGYRRFAGSDAVKIAVKRSVIPDVVACQAVALREGWSNPVALALRFRRGLLRLRFATLRMT
jgi:hypothetical protein